MSWRPVPVEETGRRAGAVVSGVLAAGVLVAAGRSEAEPAWSGLLAAAGEGTAIDRMGPAAGETSANAHSAATANFFKNEPQIRYGRRTSVAYCHSSNTSLTCTSQQQQVR